MPKCGIPHEAGSETNKCRHGNADMWYGRIMINICDMHGCKTSTSDRMMLADNYTMIALIFPEVCDAKLESFQWKQYTSGGDTTNRNFVSNQYSF